MKNKNILVFGSTGSLVKSFKRLLQNGAKLLCPFGTPIGLKENPLRRYWPDRYNRI